ncbi:MAG: chemotaxis response regulator protein-glutamate methylesterase [Chloroflexi bacterium]|nr:chemotaxis response regulator protein-glutamate methylesterase [Chloroflexota bacterium]
MSKGLKVLVVDDSAFARTRVRRRLLADPAISEVETAPDGVSALRKLTKYEPDVITLDVQMPRMDGLQALREIMATAPTPVVMVSGLTGGDSATTIQALELGAVDFFLKPDTSTPEGLAAFDQLTTIVKQAATVTLSKMASTDEAIMRAAIQNQFGAAKSATRPRRRSLDMECLAVIASSTGGPKALSVVVPQLPADRSTGYLFVQHMPAGFTKSLAERLNRSSDLEIREAEEGDKLEAGVGLMAPGGHHMTVDSRGIIRLDDRPSLHGVRPAADYTMQSAAALFGSNTVTAVLTGMGVDGRDGVRAIKEAGGSCVVEHESTCAVYGMPRAVAEAGYADKIVPLDKVSSTLTKFMNERSKRTVGAAS